MVDVPVGVLVEPGSVECSERADEERELSECAGEGGLTGCDSGETAGEKGVVLDVASDGGMVR